MKKLAIIGASYLQLPLIEKAKEMGLETHVFAWAANDVGEKIADFFYPISIVEKDIILGVCRNLKIDGICSIASDLASITVSYVACNLGLIGNSLESSELSTNKFLMRNAFKKNNDPIPDFMIINEDTEITKICIKYPAIIKPIDRSGSRGVYKIDSKSDLESALKKAINESFAKEAILEEFVDGDEYSVEYISWNGEHNFLALTEKVTTGEPRFIEKAHIEPANVSEDILKRIKLIVEHALTSLKIRYGASHSEVKIDKKGNIKIIEIGARMGGDCIGSDLVYYSTGIDFVKAVIDVSLGNKPDLSIVNKPISVKVVFIFDNEDLKELEYIKTNQPEKLIKIIDYHPERIGKTTDSSNRCGCYLVKL